MSIAHSSTDISKIYLGSTEVTKMYLGETLVYGSEQILPYDAQVMYLESNGLQYIQLPLSVAKNTYLCLDFNCIAMYDRTVTSSLHSTIFGANPWRQLYSEFYSYNSSTGRIMFTSGIGNNTSYGGYWVSTVNKTSVQISTTNIHTEDSDGVTTDRSLSRPLAAAITAFRICGGYRVNYRYPIRIYDFKITVGNAVKYDLIPVRKDGVGYLYDRIGGGLYGSTGTEDIIYGSDVGSPIDGIKFTGSQYIDLGYSPNPDTQLVMDIKFEENTVATPSVFIFLNCIGNTVGTFRMNFGAESNQYGDIFYWMNEPYDSTIWRGQYSDDIYKRSVLTYKDNSVKFLGNTVTTETKTTTQDGSLVIGCNGNLQCFDRHNLIVYKIDIYENGELIKSFRPSINGGVVGLYDSVNSVFVHSGTATEVEAVYADVSS